MKTLLSLVLAAVLAGAASAHAATDIFGSYVFLNANGAVESTAYGLEPPGAYAPLLAGAALGDFTEGVGTLTFDGGQVLTYKNGGSDVFGADVFYRVFATGGTPGGFDQLGLGFGSNATFTDAGGFTFTNGGDQMWESTAVGVDLLTGLSPDDYTLEVFARSSTNEGDRYDNAGGANFSATFSVSAVPEVSAALALPFVFGLYGGFGRRRRG